MRARRRFLAASAAGFAAALLPCGARGRPPLRFADMHAHATLRPAHGLRNAMERSGMLVLAEKIVPDSPLMRLMGNRLGSYREAGPGELRGNFESGLARLRERAGREALAGISSADALDAAVKAHRPGLVFAAEGADFLDGDLGYLRETRAQGLAHLQLVHYYRHSGVADLATEEPVHGGLSVFGQSLVRECNRLGILVDVAHCSSAGIAQAIELSDRPLVYSHGHVSARLPLPARGGIAARAIHAPLAARLAARGGVIGLWPLWYSYANLDLYCDELARLADAYGAAHVGIGTDMRGIVRSILPDYAAFALLPRLLAQRGMKHADIDAVLGGNYLRVLRTALAA